MVVKGSFQEQVIPITPDMTQQEQYDAAQYNRAMEAKNKDVNQHRVLVTAIEFKIDAYSAAVSGIMQSIRLGYESDSIGAGAEQDTLRRIWEVLVEEDDALSMVPTPW